MCSISVALFFLSAAGLTRVTLFRAQIDTILTRVSKTKCDQQFFSSLFFVIKLRLLFFRAKFVCQSESSNRKLSSKCLLFRVNGKGRKFWMPTRKSKENFKNQKGSSIWGEDLVLILVLSLERRSTGPWVSLRLGWSLFLPGTVPRDWYKNSLGSFRFENPVQNTLWPNFGCIKN